MPEINIKIIMMFLIASFLIGFVFTFEIPFCRAEPIETFYSDPDYIELKTDNKGGKYILNIESKNIGALDWIGYISQLNPENFDSDFNFYQKVKNNRTVYSKEDKQLGIVYGEAKSFFRYFDVLGNAIHWAVDKVFGDKIEDTVTIPSDEKTIYLVRAYSGGWGKLIDSEEKSFVQEKVYKGNERDKQAMVLNIGTATLDTLSIFIPFTDLVSDGLDEIVAAGFIKASRSFLEPDIIRGVPDIKDLFQISIESGEAMLIKTAEIIKKEATRSFFKFAVKNSKQLVKLINLPEKISKGGKVVDRITQMITIATPLETSYIVVGSPLLALKEKTEEISEIIEKGGPAALVPLPAIEEEKPKEEEERKHGEIIYKITGFVKNQHEEVVKEANFWLMDSKGDKYGQWKTSQTGYLEIDITSISEGNYALHIEKIDWNGLTKIPYCDPYEKKISITKEDILLGTITVHKWSKITAKVVDEFGSPIGGSLCSTFEVIDKENHSTYYYPTYLSHWRYLSENGFLETYPLPDGEYKLRVKIKWDCPLGKYTIVERKINISGNDVSLGEIVIPKE